MAHSDPNAIRYEIHKYSTVIKNTTLGAAHNSPNTQSLYRQISKT